MTIEKNKSDDNDTLSNPTDSNSSFGRGLGALKDSIESLSTSLREIQGPLSDTRNSLPMATTQLDRISTQTEQAAHRVLDMVDSISNQQVEIIKNINEAMNDLSDGGVDTKKVIAKLEKAEEIANHSQNDAFTIMDALQFQDITTQQINHAASLLEDVDDKLAAVLGDIESSGAGDGSNGSSDAERKKRIFDPHADMNVQQTDQSGIDNLIRETHEPKS